MKELLLKPGNHRKQAVIFFEFEKDRELTDRLRTLFPGLKWSQTMKSWYLATESAREVVSKLYRVFRGEVWLDYEALALKKTAGPSKPRKVKEEPERIKLNDEQKESLQKFKEYLVSSRYSARTVKTYTDIMRVFLQFLADKSPREIDNEDLLRFNNDYIIKKNYSSSYQNQAVNAVKLYSKVVNATKLDPELIRRPQRERTLPKVISKEEVKRIIESTGNLKHRAFLSIIYGCGLRRSEAINLKPVDIDSERMIIHIIKSKGKKDRIVPVSEKLLQLLREYYKAYKPETYLFEGQYSGRPYNEHTGQAILKRATEKAGIKKPVSLHWLRHSYATHLLEAGTDLRYIQEIIGHKSSKTTEIYTHVSTKEIQNIKSPFDDL